MKKFNPNQIMVKGDFSTMLETQNHDESCCNNISLKPEGRRLAKHWLLSLFTFIILLLGANVTVTAQQALCLERENLGFFGMDGDLYANTPTLLPAGPQDDWFQSNTWTGAGIVSLSKSISGNKSG